MNFKWVGQRAMYAKTPETIKINNSILEILDVINLWIYSDGSLKVVTLSDITSEPHLEEFLLQLLKDPEYQVELSSKQKEHTYMISDSRHHIEDTK